MASAFTKSFRSSSHLLAGLPALLWVLVDLSSPGFHSAAFLVHLSLLCVGFRRACRHFSFYFFPFLYETKLSPPTRRPKTKERGAHHGGASAERQIRSQWPSQQSCQGAQLRRVHVSVSACFHQLLSCFFLRIQSSLQDYLHGLLCFLHRRRMKICCLGRIHYVC